jgi:uncharacterized protein
MRIFDCHSHWGTKRGYLFRTDAELARQEKIWQTKPEILTEQEMTDYFRRNSVRALLDLGWIRFLPIEEIRGHHDYAFGVQRQHPDAIFGHWLTMDPRLGKAGVEEFERGLGAKAGFVGIAVSGQGTGVPASDPMWDPFYKLSIDAKVPVLITVGLTGIGQGARGGDGLVLDNGHPRHIDSVAARFPDLDILAGRPAYPWQDDMIAVLLHKGNVHYELHGWSPRYFSPALKKEIGGRLQDRIMFGCDYPVLKYEKMLDHWKAMGYTDKVLEKVFHRNAESYFPGAGRK